MTTINVKPKIHFKINKVKLFANLVLSLALMGAGYLAISQGIVYANQKLDAYATARVMSRGLVGATTVTVSVPVITTADVKAQVDQAIAANLGK